jgi:hypothetical protein
MPEDTRRKVERAAHRKGKSFSATATELIEKQLAEDPGVSPFEALIGAIDDSNLQAADMDDVLRGLAADADDRNRR